VFELTGALVPQNLVPQGALVTTVKTGWRMAWVTLMRELAPQSKEGDYVRPSYGFKGEIGTSAFPDEPARYHLYVGKVLTCSQGSLSNHLAPSLRTYTRARARAHTHTHTRYIHKRCTHTHIRTHTHTHTHTH